MAKRARKPLLGKALQKSFKAMARTAVRASSRAVSQALVAAPKVAKVMAKTPGFLPEAQWCNGVAVGAGGPRRYWLYQPPGTRRTERLPLVVMLHGCGQDAEALAASSRMSRVAARERFLVLLPEQDRLAHVQGCWHWYDTRSGRAQREASSIEAVIEQVCLLYPVDRERIAVAGLSAGAGMAALLALLRPERFRAVAMHSGVGPGVAHSSASALAAMGGRSPLPTPPSAAESLPPLLVIQGSRDLVVAPSNGSAAAQLWAARMGAQASTPRQVKRGTRYASILTDFRSRGRIVATLCEIVGLGHAWSGGAPGMAFSDPKGPDASGMMWTFFAKQFVKR